MRKMIRLFIALSLALATVPTSSVAQIPIQSEDRSATSAADKDSAFKILTKLTPPDLVAIKDLYGPVLIKKIEHEWWSQIPVEARPPQSKQGIVEIAFHVAGDGKVSQMRILSSSGDASMDRAAWGAIVAATPYPPFPSGMEAKDVELQLSFRYNMK